MDVGKGVDEVVVGSRDAGRGGGGIGLRFWFWFVLRVRVDKGADVGSTQRLINAYPMRIKKTHTFHFSHNINIHLPPIIPLPTPTNDSTIPQNLRTPMYPPLPHLRRHLIFFLFPPFSLTTRLLLQHPTRLSPPLPFFSLSFRS